jgi:hypothetical protein
MADTATAADQAAIDAETFKAFERNGENKAATGRELSVSAGTVAERIKRHLERVAQDEAGEPGEAFGDLLDEDPELAGLVQENEQFAEALPGICADDQLAYKVPCPVKQCTATEAGMPCTNGNRDGEAVEQPWAHDRRVEAAKAAVEAGEIEADAEPPAEVEAGGGLADDIDEGDEVVEVPVSDTAGGPVEPAPPAAAPAASKPAKAARAPKTAPAATAPKADRPAPAPGRNAGREKATHCELCGHHFSQPRARARCKSDSACKKRQARAAAA